MSKTENTDSQNVDIQVVSDEPGANPIKLYCKAMYIKAPRIQLSNKFFLMQSGLVYKNNDKIF